MNSPSGSLSGDGSAQARSHWVGIWGQCPHNLCGAHTNFVVLKKICFKQSNKNKNIPP